MRRYGQEDLAKELEEDERAYPLYQSGLFLLRELGVERVHIHNLGYYVVVLRKPYHCPPAVVRDGCLFASAVNARKAQVGGFIEAASLTQCGRTFPVSDVGMQQMERFTEEVRTRRAQPSPVWTTAIWEANDHFVLVVPSHIVPNPIVTVGMGDTISSSSYYYEVCEAQIMNAIPVIVYSDYVCPWCYMIHASLERVSQRSAARHRVAGSSSCNPKRWAPVNPMLWRKRESRSTPSGRPSRIAQGRVRARAQTG